MWRAMSSRRSLRRLTPTLALLTERAGAASRVAALAQTGTSIQSHNSKSRTRRSPSRTGSQPILGLEHLHHAEGGQADDPEPLALQRKLRVNKAGRERGQVEGARAQVQIPDQVQPEWTGQLL